ncbi:MBG domain-containing protein, partial [Echinicola salinicaeni]|uniref:MBG domain-containing protein n=1 Tax=Echinicola salinicaeni TaxID=2762757 RepID=UPI0016476D4C
MKNFTACYSLSIVLIFFLYSINSFGQTTLDFNGITKSTALSLNETNTYDTAGVRFQIFSGSNSNAYVSSSDQGFNNTRALDDTNLTFGGVTGWKITKEVGDKDFQLRSIWLQEGCGCSSTSGTVKAYKDGTQVGSTVNVTFNGTQNFIANPDFYDIDEVRIEGTDLYIYIDNFTYGDPYDPGALDPTVVTSIDLVGSPLTTDSGVSYEVNFSKNANNVTADDFELIKTGSAVGTIGTVSGSGSSYTVTVNGLGGEGSIRLDLKSGTDIQNDSGNSGTPAFISGEVHYVGACNVETFESIADASTSFSSNGINFSLGTGLETENRNGFGAGTSDRYITNDFTAGSFSLSSVTNFTMKTLDIFLSDQTNGNDPTGTGTLSITGKLGGANQFTITKNTGFPTTTTSNNGFFTIDFSTDGAADYRNTNIDELVFTIGGGFIELAIDNFNFCEASTAPTASNFTGANGPYENLTYTFATSDFGYNDSDPLNHVLIESLPPAGTLYVDADNDDAYDAGEEVNVNDQISKSDLDAGDLQYIQNGSTNASFQFEVNDGSEYSSGDYIATLNVNPVPTVTLSILPTSKSESITTPTQVTATLSNTYGEDVNIVLDFNGTATDLGVDYSLTATSIIVPAGNTTGNINLTNVPDALYEGNETVIIDIASVTGGTESGTQQVTYTITDDDIAPNASLEILNIYNPITNESGGQAYVRGKIDAIAGTTITIPLSFSGTASGGGTDYSITGSTIILSPGEYMDSIRVTSQHDGFEEGDETIIIDMGTPTNAVESGTQQVTLTIKDEDLAAPTGYSVTIDQSSINSSNESAVSFTFAGAEIGATYNYTFSSTGGGTNLTGTGTISTATDQITGIDLSGLGDGTITLSVTLTDTFGSTGIAATDTVIKDTTAPSGYSVSIDQSPINNTNQSTASFTFSGAEIGTTYNYTFSSSGGGTNVTGSGTIATATDQVTGIDLSGLGDGTVTLSVTLTDDSGNAGSAATDTAAKDSTAPSGYSVSMDLLGETIINSINETIIEFAGAGLEVGSTLNYSFTSSGGGAAVSGTETVSSTLETFNNGGAGYDLSSLTDGTISLTVSLTDPAGNQGTNATDSETKDAGPPTGYTVSWDDNLVNATEAGSTSFSVANAEIGTRIYYSISSSGDGNTATISGNTNAGSVTEMVTVDVSSLVDGTLRVQAYLRDAGGNTGATVSNNSAVLDQTAPSGYSISIDQNPIDRSNQASVSYTFAGAEVGSTYNYTFSSSGTGTNVTGSGTIATASDQVTGIDLSGLGDGTITVSVTLTDAAGNTGSLSTGTSTKDTNEAPTASAVSINGTITVGEQLTGTYTFADANSDPESGSTYKWYRSDDNSGTGKTAISGANAQQYTLQVSDQGKYISFEVTPNDGTDIGTAIESGLVGPIKVEQTITFPSIPNKTYGDVSFTLGDAQTDQGLTVTYTAVDPTVVSISGNQATVLKAGNTQITATQTGDGVTNAANPVVQTLTVNKAALTVTANDQSKVYGSTDPALTVSYTGFVNSEDETALGGTLTLNRAVGEDVGTYAITASGYTSGNYTISYTDGNFEITQAALTVTADDQSKVYGATEPSLTVSYSGFMNGDDETALGGTLDVSRASGEDVGTYAITASGYTSGNYTISYMDGSFEITQAALTITADDKSKVYGDTDPSLTVSYSGFVNGDDETALSGTLDVSRAAGEDVGTYAITASGYTSGNYTISYVDGRFEITPAALTVTADDQSKVYGATDPSLTVSYSGFVNSDDETVLNGTLDVSRAAGEDVGTYAITASGYTSGNYTISYVDGSFEITQAALTITADDKSKVYGATDPSLTVSYTGFVNGDDETSLGGTLAISRAAGEDVGTYTITASGYTSGNYTISYMDGSFEITQAALTITADDKSKVYGATDPSITVSYSGFMNGDDETALGGTLDVSRAAGEDVGTYAITASGYTSGNYTISYMDGSFEITQAALTVTADDQGKVYGETDPALTVSYSGFVNGDDETALGGSLDVSRATGEDVGTYAITASGYTSGNYTISYMDGSFEIIPSALTVTADDQGKVYGESDPALTVSYSGFVNGDDETALGGTLDVSRAAGEDVGTYAITASGYTSSNYTISYIDGAFEITPAALTVTTDDQSKVYGTADPGLTVSYSGFVNGDDATALGGTLDVSRAAGEDVGTYAITASGYTSSNYTISYTDGNFEITQAALTVTADDKSKVYGDTEPSLTVSYSGFVNGDYETTLGGTLDVSRTAGEDVGTYAITASGYTSGNYTISYVDGSFEITKAALTVTADNQSKVYGDTDPSLTVSYIGFVNGDDETALGGTLDVSRTAGEDVGTYAITASGYTSGNYTISYVDGSFAITQAALTVTADDKSKVYGATEPSLTVSYSGFVNGDDETALGGTLDVSRTAGEDVGNYTITASGYTSGNYTISYVDSNFAITPAALTVTADDQSKVYGDADPALTVTYSGFVNGDDETALGGTLDVSRTAGEDVGTYAITASGYTSGNYTISYMDGSFEITQAALTVIADDQSKVYGEPDPALTVSYSGFVNGDDETALGGNLDVRRAAGEDVGNYAITASGYTSSNYTISYVDGNLEISQADLSVVADDQSKVYGTADPVLSYTTSGFVNGDDDSILSGSLSRVSGEDIGVYAIELGSLSAGENYNIVYQPATLSIQGRKIEEVYEPAALTVDWGVAVDGIMLPETVLVRTEQDELINLNVNWNTSPIDTRA